jgi:hypothetical protein
LAVPHFEKWEKAEKGDTFKTRKKIASFCVNVTVEKAESKGKLRAWGWGAARRKGTGRPVFSPGLIIDVF